MFSNLEVFSYFVYAELTNNLREHACRLEMTLLSLVYKLLSCFFSADLNSCVTISLSGLHLCNHTRTSGKQSHSLNYTVFCDGAGHADFPRNECLHRSIDPYLFYCFGLYARSNKT